jgi:hypothetical protein
MSNLKNPCYRTYSFQKLTQLSKGNNMQGAATSNIDGFLWKDTCVSSTQLNWPFGIKWAFLHLENYDLLRYSFQKFTQFLQGNNVQDAAASNREGFLLRDTCVSSTQLNRPCGIKWAFLHLETMIYRKYFFKKLTQFSLGNNVLDANSSNTDGCLWTDTCVSLAQLNRPIWDKLSLSHLENYDFQKVFLSKTKSILTGQQCSIFSCFLHRRFSLEGYMCSFKLAE